jgi:hypothetical protein
MVHIEGICDECDCSSFCIGDSYSLLCPICFAEEQEQERLDAKYFEEASLARAEYIDAAKERRDELMLDEYAEFLDRYNLD